jgi:predicted RNase H-like nuclease (RuvC/YqgF family)
VEAGRLQAQMGAAVKKKNKEEISDLWETVVSQTCDINDLTNEIRSLDARFCTLADAVTQMQQSKIDTLGLFKRIEALEKQRSFDVVINTKLDDMRTRIDRLQSELIDARRNAVNINTIKSFEHDIYLHTKWLQDLERMIKALKPKAKAKPKAKPNGKHQNAVAARGSDNGKR